MITLDGNEAAASVAHRLSEVICIYPITPSSTMGELADEWSAKGKRNIWGEVPRVMEMQSEAGAAGAVHGALQAGALSTTFTASQGLLLMIPNMYKIAGELTPFVMHVTARTLATHALSIFGDHSDVYACRQTGFAMLCSNSPQEAHDMALIAHSATLESRVPFLHFFDGFRTSHEVAKISALSDDDLRQLVDERCIAAHRQRALTPDHPILRGTAQNPDAFFQARESCTPFYAACPSIVQAAMARFAALTGRAYKLVEYHGHPAAERVVVAMGSACETIEQTVDHLIAQGQRVGLIKVRLYRPFPVRAFVEALPSTVKSIAVLDRTKEPGAPGDPLYLDATTALLEAQFEGFLPTPAIPRLVNGRYGLASKEFTPAMVKAIFDELAKPQPKNHFTVGIVDDVSHSSLPVDDSFDIEGDDVKRAVFYGLGADGTVGANKNSIKIIGEETDNWAQGYFVYDSKKSGAMTISHLRFGPKPIRSPYLIRRAGFVAVHQWKFLEKLDVFELAAPGATVLLNSPFGPDETFDKLPVELQTQIVDRKLKLYVIDAYQVARDTGMGVRINTIMQTCFFAISGVLPRDEAIDQIKKAIKKTYGRKGEQVVKNNFIAVDHTLAHLFEVKVPAAVTGKLHLEPIVTDDAPDFVKRVSGMMLANKGDLLPVSAFPIDGSWPLGTARYEKRNIATEIPVWEEAVCIQCNKCVMACPHAAIRAKVYDPTDLSGAPETFKSVDYKAVDLKGKKYTLQVAPEDCTGCTVCVAVCPAKNKTNPREKAINMRPQMPIREAERKNFDFFLNLPEADRSQIRIDVKGSQLLQPLFEFSGACSGCGETPYVKLLTQLFGDRALIANATGCSSIYGGNLPTTPYCTNRDGRGPAWSNSLFEDNAEFGLGLRLGVSKHAEFAQALVKQLAPRIGDNLVNGILSATQTSEAEIGQQRGRVAALRQVLRGIINDPAAAIADGSGWAPAQLATRLDQLADYLVHKSVWILGGDGWAYDIGFGGLDHVIATGQNVNILVLDTEVYSNTGGQQSKSTPLGAAAKFAAAGKTTPKKDLGLIAMSYGNVYVARVAFGAKDVQTVKAFQEAESYDGPSLIIAYSHCIAHGYDLAHGIDQQKLAVDTGYWPLFRYDPRRVATGQPAMQLDSAAPKGHVEQFVKNETRFRMVEQQGADRFKELMRTAKRDIDARFALYSQLAGSAAPAPAATPASASASAAPAPAAAKPPAAAAPAPAPAAIPAPEPKTTNGNGNSGRNDPGGNRRPCRD
jgi:pyruvate-ferredoxin/flavodoxin oxidoreductase